MKKWKERWKKLLPYEKCASVALQIIMAITFPMLIGSILQLSDVIRSPFNFNIASQAMMCAYSGCYAVRSWRKQRASAITFIVAAGLCAAAVILYSI